MPGSAESYSLLAKQAKGKALVHLIQQAIDDPTLFSFHYLLTAPHIDTLKQEGDQSDMQLLRLLEIFSYGTYSDYTQHATSLPRISPNATRKLKILSLLTLCNVPSISYADMIQALDLNTPAQAEELVIEALYASLLTGKLNSAQQILTVESCVGRDPRPDTLPELENKLGRWLETCEDMMTALQAQRTTIYESARARTLRKQLHAQAVAELAGTSTTTDTKTPNNGRGKRPAVASRDGLQEDGEHVMDVDGEGVSGVTRKRKSSGRRA